MSPIYEYRCPNGHVHERLRKISERDNPASCLVCMGQALPIISLPHIEPDGVYSYEPNVGSKDDFDRKQAKLAKHREQRKDGKKPKLTPGREVE